MSIIFTLHFMKELNEATYYVPIPNAYINPNTNKSCINYCFKT